MEFLFKMGEAFEAEKMVDAESVYVHAAIPVDYLEELTEGTEGTRVFTTTHANANPCALDPEGCRRIGLPEDYDIYELIRDDEPPEKVFEIFRRMGYFITHTFTHFLRGQHPQAKWSLYLVWILRIGDRELMVWCLRKQRSDRSFSF
jgi:predicted aconitase